MGTLHLAEFWASPPAKDDVPIGWAPCYLPNYLENNRSARVMVSPGAKEAGRNLVTNLREHLPGVIAVRAAETIQAQNYPHSSYGENAYSSRELLDKLGEYNPSLLVVITGTDFSVDSKDGDPLVIDILTEGLNKDDGPMVLALGSVTLKGPAGIDLLGIPVSERSSSQQLLGTLRGDLKLDRSGKLRKNHIPEYPESQPVPLNR